MLILKYYVKEKEKKEKKEEKEKGAVANEFRTEGFYENEEENEKNKRRRLMGGTREECGREQRVKWV